MGGAHLRLDARLSTIAAMATPCACLADIGTDHGRLGAYMLQNGLCRRAQFTDISGASLEKARRMIDRLKLADRAVFSVGDGAEALLEAADAVVIAGMGGTTIAGIVERGRAALGDARLVLQPNVGAPELRSRLSQAGYAIVDERVVQDGRRNYIILAAERGPAAYTEEELIVGPLLLRRKPPELLPYARFRLRVARKALRGAAAGDAQAAEDALRREIEIWEEMEKCLQA